MVGKKRRWGRKQLELLRRFMRKQIDDDIEVKADGSAVSWLSTTPGLGKHL